MALPHDAASVSHLPPFAALEPYLLGSEAIMTMSKKMGDTRMLELDPARLVATLASGTSLQLTLTLPRAGRYGGTPVTAA